MATHERKKQTLLLKNWKNKHQNVTVRNRRRPNCRLEKIRFFVNKIPTVWKKRRMGKNVTKNKTIHRVKVYFKVKLSPVTNCGVKNLRVTQLNCLSLNPAQKNFTFHWKAETHSSHLLSNPTFLNLLVFLTTHNWFNQKHLNLLKIIATSMKVAILLNLGALTTFPNFLEFLITRQSPKHQRNKP